VYAEDLSLNTAFTYFGYGSYSDHDIGNIATISPFLLIEYLILTGRQAVRPGISRRDQKMENKIRLFNTLEFLVATPVAPLAQAEEAVALLQSIGATEAAITGRASVLTEKRVVEDWTFMPWDQDTCPLPPIAWQRMIALQQAGIIPVSYVIAHEPIKHASEVLLPAKTQVVGGWDQAKAQMAKFQAAATPVAQQAVKSTKQWAETAKPVARQVAEDAKQWAVAAAPVTWQLTKVMAKATVAVAGALGVLTLGAIGLMTSVLLVDPILFALLPVDDGGDPVWVVVARWHN
jgi:hypothetical protein